MTSIQFELRDDEDCLVTEAVLQGHPITVLSTYRGYW